MNKVKPPNYKKAMHLLKNGNTLLKNALQQLSIRLGDSPEMNTMLTNPHNDFPLWVFR